MKTFYLYLFAAMFALPAFSQVKISDTGTGDAASNTVLELETNNKGLLLPLLTAAQRNSIAETGLLIYNTTTNTVQVNTPSGWKSLTESGPVSDGTSASTTTTNNRGLRIGTDGSLTPGAVLDLASTNQALLLPRVSDVNAVATPTKGLLVYSIAQQRVLCYNGTAWMKLNV